MSRVVLAAAGDDLCQRVLTAADGDVHVLPAGRLPGDPARLFEQLLDGELPEVLVIGPDAPAEQVLTLAARLDAQCPGISVLLVARPEPALLQAAMRAGIRDLLDPASDAAELRAAIERAPPPRPGAAACCPRAGTPPPTTGRASPVPRPRGVAGKPPAPPT